MAKVGEGDDRWIVAERQDGTNVNSWHWQEKDAFGWSRERFADLIGAIEFEDGTWYREESKAMEKTIRDGKLMERAQAAPAPTSG